MAGVSHNTKPWVSCVESSLIPRDFTVPFFYKLESRQASREENSSRYLAPHIEAGSLSEGQGFGRPGFGHPGCPVSAEFPNGELTVPVLNTQGSLSPWSLGETKRFPGECILLSFISDTELCVYLCTKCYFVNSAVGGGSQLLYLLLYSAALTHLPGIT